MHSISIRKDFLLWKPFRKNNKQRQMLEKQKNDDLRLLKRLSLMAIFLRISISWQKKKKKKRKIRENGR